MVVTSPRILIRMFAGKFVAATILETSFVGTDEILAGGRHIDVDRPLQLVVIHLRRREDGVMSATWFK